MKTKNFLEAAAAIVICELAGLIGSIFTTSAIPSWYNGLVKPQLAPPNWLFGPVWTLLFALMGIAVYLVWRRFLQRDMKKIALWIFGGQLVLNILWSVLFFGLRSPGWAFVEIVVLWLAILASIIAFSKLSRLAAWLLVPYLAWVSFATYLNYSIWMLN